MDWTSQIDSYCERIDFSFWSEPLNALTNLAFVVAAFWALALWRRKTPDDRAALAMICVVLATGIGSFLFHTYATRWAAMADVVPIALFIFGYLFLALRRFLRLSLLLSAGGLLSFAILTPFVVRAGSAVMGSSAAYLPALLAIFGVALACYSRNRMLSGQLALAGAIFMVSLTCRILDGLICTQWHYGTHFLWHIFNGVLLFWLLRVLIDQRAGYTLSQGSKI